MIVVADSSPIIALVNIEQINLLPELFKGVVIPPAVASELAGPKRPKAVRDLVATPPSWLQTRAPKTVEAIPRLDPGESQAISLARELKADLVLIDERRAYHAAIARNIPAIGTIRILERAAENGIIDLKLAFDRLMKTDFWIREILLDKRLELYEQAKKTRDA